MAFIVADFPDTYTSQLVDFIYPSAYITCFSAKNNDSVMWGNYADNHKEHILYTKLTMIIKLK